MPGKISPITQVQLKVVLKASQNREQRPKSHELLPTPQPTDEDTQKSLLSQQMIVARFMHNGFVGTSLGFGRRVSIPIASMRGGMRNWDEALEQAGKYTKNNPDSRIVYTKYPNDEKSITIINAADTPRLLTCEAANSSNTDSQENALIEELRKENLQLKRELVSLQEQLAEISSDLAKERELKKVVREVVARILYKLTKKAACEIGKGIFEIIKESLSITLDLVLDSIPVVSHIRTGLKGAYNWSKRTKQARDINELRILCEDMQALLRD